MCNNNGGLCSRASIPLIAKEHLKAVSKIGDGLKWGGVLKAAHTSSGVAMIPRIGNLGNQTMDLPVELGLNIGAKATRSNDIYVQHANVFKISTARRGKPPGKHVRQLADIIDLRASRGK